MSSSAGSDPPSAPYSPPRPHILTALVPGPAGLEASVGNGHGAVSHSPMDHIRDLQQKLSPEAFKTFKDVLLELRNKVLTFTSSACDSLVRRRGTPSQQIFASVSKPVLGSTHPHSSRPSSRECIDPLLLPNLHLVLRTRLLWLVSQHPKLLLRHQQRY